MEASERPQGKCSMATHEPVCLGICMLLLPDYAQRAQQGQLTMSLHVCSCAQTLDTVSEQQPHEAEQSRTSMKQNRAEHRI